MSKPALSRTDSIFNKLAYIALIVIIMTGIADNMAATGQNDPGMKITAKKSTQHALEPDWNITTGVTSSN